VIQRTDDGFSLVEVLVAMFLLALMAIAVLPLLISASQVSVSNRELTTATAFANAQLAPIKAGFPPEPASPKTCSSLQTTAAHDVPGPGGLVADIEVNPCPVAAGDYPASVPVTVTVSSGEESEVVTLVTRIPVGAP